MSHKCLLLSLANFTFTLFNYVAIVLFSSLEFRTKHQKIIYKGTHTHESIKYLIKQSIMSE